VTDTDSSNRTLHELSGVYAAAGTFFIDYLN